MRRFRLLLKRLLRTMTQMKTRKPFRPDELGELLAHVAYEWLIFDERNNRVSKDPANAQPHELECLLTHVRALREFLFSTADDYPARLLDKALFATDYV